MQFLKYFIERSILTRGIEVLHVLLPLLITSICTHYTVTLASADDTEIFVRSECNYLKQGDDQSNAFLSDGQFGHICCMCPVGTKYTGICDSTDPTSTVCEPCEDGWYQDFQPHTQEICRPQILKNCLDPYIPEEGSITKSSKCICKPGTEEVSKKCKAIPVSGGSPITTTDSTILTKITQNLSSAKTTATTMPSTKANKTIIPVYATPTATVKSVTDIKSTTSDTLSSSTVKTYLDSTTFTDHIKKNAQEYTGLQPWKIALIAIGLLGFLLLVYACWSRYKTGSTRKDEASVKYDGTSSSTDLSSKNKLVNVNELPLPGCIGRIRRFLSSMRETVQAPNEAGPPLRRNRVQREDSSATPIVNSVNLSTHQVNERLLGNGINQNQEVALHYTLPAIDEFGLTARSQSGEANNSVLDTDGPDDPSDSEPNEGQSLLSQSTNNGSGDPGTDDVKAGQQQPVAQEKNSDTSSLVVMVETRERHREPEAQKNMAGPIDSGNQNGVVRESIEPVLHTRQVDPRLSSIHRELRLIAVMIIAANITSPDRMSFGHFLIPNHVELDSIIEEHRKDGHAEVSRRVFIRGFELNPNLSLYELRDEARRLNLGYLEAEFEDQITQLERVLAQEQ